MKVELINPFIEQLVKVLETMGEFEPKHDSPFLKQGSEAFSPYTGQIPINGIDAYGHLALSFKPETIHTIACKFIGEELSKDAPECVEILGELANMVSGGAKAKLADQGINLGLSSPTFTDKAQVIDHPESLPVIVIPFNLNGLPFHLEVSLKERTKN